MLHFTHSVSVIVTSIFTIITPLSKSPYSPNSPSSHQDIFTRLPTVRCYTWHYISTGHGTVCHQQSLLHQCCIHSVEPWKLICTPHLSHHLSYIICILTSFWPNVTSFDDVRWPCSLLTLRHSNLFFYVILHIKTKIVSILAIIIK